MYLLLIMNDICLILSVFHFTFVEYKCQGVRMKYIKNTNKKDSNHFCKPSFPGHLLDGLMLMDCVHRISDNLRICPCQSRQCRNIAAFLLFSHFYSFSSTSVPSNCSLYSSSLPRPLLFARYNALSAFFSMV